jgi:site-specific DNA-methyltransferase (adenine-specific)
VWAIPRTSHWTATALENAGFEIRDVVTHLFGSGFPKSLDISKAIDKAAGVERDTILRTGKVFTGSNDNISGLTGQYESKSNDAKQWAGWGTALKPASEHWILIRKHGVGGINIDVSRVASDSMPKTCTNQNIKSGAFNSDNSERDRDSVYTPSTQGRFPANLVLSHSVHCQDDQCDIECAIVKLDEQSGVLHSRPNKNPKKLDASPKWYENKDPNKLRTQHDISGGASRFFYCAKISTSERNAGAENNHPTVKPKKLMSYFIKMITPPNGTVLDPFMGSGSTGIAARECNFGFVGIEKESEYFEIAKNRINV